MFAATRPTLTSAYFNLKKRSRDGKTTYSVSKKSKVGKVEPPDTNFYCSHCGKRNHDKSVCFNKDKPANRFSSKLHALRTASTNGRIEASEVRKLLGKTPLSLISLYEGSEQVEPESESSTDRDQAFSFLENIGNNFDFDL